jgi:type I restriction enzyme S subunit
VREGWTSARLNEVCLKIQDGAHRSPQKFYAESGVGRFPYITSKNIRNGYMDLDDVPFVDAAFHNSIYPRCNPELGDILLTKDGANTGNVTINTYGEPFSLLSSVCLIKTDPTKLVPKFVVYYIQSDAGFRQITGSMTGAAIKRIILQTIKSSSIPLPALAEQRRIVAILDETFEGLATVAANAETNLKNARELFDSYLNSIFKLQDGEWAKKSLRDVAIEFGRGKSKHRPRNDPALYDGKYPFVQTGDIRNSGGVITEYSQTYNETGLAQSKLWPKGTICITIAANIAETGILDFDACFPDSIIGMVVDPAQTNNKFVEYLLRFFKAALQAQGKGSAQDNINLATFENRKFPFPPIKIQDTLAAKLDGIAKEVERLEVLYQAKLKNVSELKQAILQRAFRGELASPPTRAIKEAAE